MKCPKCNAENISEAVKCGVCGTRLKQVKITNDFTGASHVQSSVQRQQTTSNTTLPSRHNRPQRPTQSAQNQQLYQTISHRARRLVV